MKQNKISVVGLFLVIFPFLVLAQEGSKKQLTATIQYFSEENKIMYFKVTAKAKIQGRFRTIPGIKIHSYLDAESPENSIDSATTNEEGLAKFYFPEKLKKRWESTGTHTILANAIGNDTLSDGSGEITITKSKIIIDTLVEDGIRKVIITASSFDNEAWMPIKGMELKPGVKRIGGLLKVTPEELYTTDSSGKVVVEFTDSLVPGDVEGNLYLAAKVEENENFGNLIVTKSVRWGKPTVLEHNFFSQRTLWSTRFHTPYWLLFIVYGMSIGIWGTIISIIIKLIKTIKLGRL